MNFLAHAYLSGENGPLLIGNFIADFVKGRSALMTYDAGIRQGILLHRAIDAFTDTHPVVHESKDRLRPKYRHYSGVIVDVFYDHFLASQWRQYHTASLAAFSAGVYATVSAYESVLPVAVRQFFPYMVRTNWLVSYASIEGIARALGGMARRTPYVSRMDEATTDLEQHYEQFSAEFNRFFPELINHVSAFGAGAALK